MNAEIQLSRAERYKLIQTLWDSLPDFEKGFTTHNLFVLGLAEQEEREHRRSMSGFSSCHAKSFTVTLAAKSMVVLYLLRAWCRKRATGRAAKLREVLDCKQSWIYCAAMVEEFWKQIQEWESEILVNSTKLEAEEVIELLDYFWLSDKENA